MKRKFFTVKITATALLAALFLLCAVLGLCTLPRTAHADERGTEVSKELSEKDISWGLDKYEVYYNGAPQTPNVIINKPVLNKSDYEVSYSDNVNAGTATVTLTITGKYTGVFSKTFTILPQEDAVIWQYLSGGTWKELTDFGHTFVYKPGTGSSGHIRAVLSSKGEVEHVYAKGAAAADGEYYLGFTSGGAQAEFKNAATYTVSIEGEGSFPFKEDDRSVTVNISPATLGIGKSDFESYIDNDGNRLWLLSYGDGKTSELRDAATYFDPDAKENEYGDKVAVGTTPDSYARYTGDELDLKLNGEYVFGNGVKLADYLSAAKCSYAHSNITNSNAGTTGEAQEVHKIETTVTLAFDSNFKGENTLTFSKTWYIVTANNDLRDSDGGAQHLHSELGGWTFGEAPEIALLRPEHGDTVIYTYRKKGSDEVLREFAVVFSNELSNAALAYYETKDENGKPVSDKANPISQKNYYNVYLKSLSAGEYCVTVHVPQFEIEDLSGHTHWWDEVGDVADEPDTVFYEITRTYAFTVSTYTLSKDGETPNDGFEINLLSDTVVYNGKENNTPPLRITLNGRELTEGVDYRLASEQRDVGTASLTVTGIGSLRGTIEYPDYYTIAQATNTWAVVPNVMNWSYGDYRKQVNLIEAVPTYLDNAEDLWFKITSDAEGQNVVPGLEKFHLDEEGFVSDEVQTILSSLSATEYYLFAIVEGNENHTGLAPAGVAFRVFAATNYWEIAPHISASWIKGGFDETENYILSKARFGNENVVIIVTNSKDEVIYDSAKGINELKKASVGVYLVTATVAQTDNYSALTYTSSFRVFAASGFPWWGTLVIVAAVLLIAALILLILQRRGVLHLLSGKMISAIRTKEAIDATIAAVKANKAAAEAKASVAKAQSLDREEARRIASADAQAKPVEESAAEIEARAAALEKRAKTLSANAENLRRKAAAKEAAEKEAAVSDLAEDDITE